jgi:hypothetical protein
MCFVWRCVGDRRTISTTEANTCRSWLVYKIVDIIRYRAVQHPAVIATGVVTNVLIIISVLSAFPWIRKSVMSRPGVWR